jgi:group I intron endonuclease
MENKIYNVVYRTVNKTNGKIYVGSHSTTSLNDSYLGSGKYIKKALKKYGRENFYIEHLFFCETREQAFEIERYAIRDHIEVYGKRNVYNAKPVACGHIKGESHPMWGKTHSDRLKKKWSKERRGEGNAFYGKTHTEETRKRLSEASSSHTGNKNPFYGKHHSKETKQKLSELAKERFSKEDNPFYGKSHTEESKKKLSETRKERGLGKKPLWFRGEYFESRGEAAKRFFPDKTLNRACFLIRQELRN